MKKSCHHVFMHTYIFLVHGFWMLWTTWTACPVTCGEANQTRTRSCTNPPPQFGGTYCNNTEEEGAEESNTIWEEPDCPS